MKNSLLSLNRGKIEKHICGRFIIGVIHGLCSIYPAGLHPGARLWRKGKTTLLHPFGYVLGVLVPVIQSHGFLQRSG